MVDGFKPPNANPAFCVPAPANLVVAIPKAPPTLQDVPLYSSVQETTLGEHPPTANPAFCVPADPIYPLEVIIFEGALLQDEPSYFSVAPVTDGVSDPKANAAVCVPAPDKWLLAIFKAPPAVQAVPLYSSVKFVADSPPKPKPAH